MVWIKKKKTVGTQNFHQTRVLVPMIMQEVVNTLREEREKKKREQKRKRLR